MVWDVKSILIENDGMITIGVPFGNSMDELGTGCFFKFFLYRVRGLHRESRTEMG